MRARLILVLCLLGTQAYAGSCGDVTGCCAFKTREDCEHALRELIRHDPTAAKYRCVPCSENETSV